MNEFAFEQDEEVITDDDKEGYYYYQDYEDFDQDEFLMAMKDEILNL